ncbi:MAG: type 2 isopentenyl-diphosphate Delta-isomerase [Archaeoglobaceae archaeon]|nr:type 2 isopentenyl-diphosphate Delta-isomerase [Archaeoglobaceae archaeon]MCX8152566.1 type 2 isopentenyl-diphosphate Delta-isomerase [Archaeoglobaceae archaeon]MDW8014152.1 type 2 isopentenyl-diphosphate Delta-isomerase [Archaeoglobaceae archaeon]
MQTITSNRKLEHIKICLEMDVETKYTGLEDITLLHKALPEIDFDEIDTSTKIFGKKLSFPFLIASMTGGHPETKKINENLAEAVEKTKIGMGVGSQRAAIENKSLEDTFSVVRDKAPKAFIYANIGVPQLLQHGVEIIDKVVELVDADAVAVHLNFLQEILQPEGDKKAKGCMKLIEEVCKYSKVPVIVKETGAGIIREIALELKKVGVSALDIGGKGGTSFSKVESYRASEEIWKKVGADFWDWGVPTAFCIVDCKDVLPTIATGGLRSGVDVAKCLAIGAKVASAALPFLKDAMKSSEDVEKKIEYFKRGLKTCMFLMGCKKVEELRSLKIFVSGKFRDWLEFRKIDVFKFMEGER